MIDLLLLLQTCPLSESPERFVDLDHLQDFNADMTKEVVEDQLYRFIPALEGALHRFVLALDPSVEHAKTHFSLAFLNAPHHLSLRKLKADSIGRLVSFRATVTRVSDVRPELVSGDRQRRHVVER